MDQAAEILRLRQQVHDLRVDKRATELRLDNAESQLATIRGQVEAIVKADELAQAVANELASRDNKKSTNEKLGLTRAQFRFTVSFGALTLILGIVGNLQAAGWLGG